MARAETIAALALVAERVRPTTLARERVHPVLPPLESLLPDGGLRRGSSVSVSGPAAISLALALAAAASDDGAWVAAVGFPSLGLAAAAEFGVALERFVLVAEPPPSVWANTIAALVDAFPLVLVQAGGRVKLGDGRRLGARVRERGAVLFQVGTGAWPEGADVDLRVDHAVWEGLGDGHGHLQGRRVRVTGTGRRSAARPRQAELWLPGPDGGVEAVVDAPLSFPVAGGDGP